ncbi:MAG: SCP2 sterol-binding domain-containing protein [Nannocystaceae bacterium]
MSLEDYTSTVREKVGEDSGLDAKIKFVFNDGGVLFIDGQSRPNRVSNDDEEAHCTVKLSSEDFGSLLRRELDPMAAFMGGKLKIEGDMGVAMKLGRLFS